MSARLKARSFPERMSDVERGDWQSFVADKLNADKADWPTLATYMDQVRETRAQLIDEPATGRDVALLDALLMHGERLAEQYPAP